MLRITALSPRRLAAVFVVLFALMCLVGAIAGPAHAAPADPCAELHGHLKDACENTQKMVTNPNDPTKTPNTIDFATDPLGSIATSAGQGASWLVDQIGKVVDSSTPNFTNLGFLVVYAVVFGASTLLTVILWLGAVVKRVIRAESAHVAIGEAVGYLWVGVIISAFVPVILAGLTILTDKISDGIRDSTTSTMQHVAGGSAAGPGGFLGPLSANLAAGPQKGAGGDFLFIFIAALTLLVAAALWVELLMRTALLYAGTAIAPAILAGVVDKDLWGHVRQWAAMIASLLLLKPLIEIILLLGEAITSTAPAGGGIPSIIAGTSVLWVAAFAQFSLYRMLPGWGDSVRAEIKRGQTLASHPQTTQVAGTAAQITSGIAAHAGRATFLTPKVPTGAGPSSGGGAGQIRMRPESKTPTAITPPKAPARDSSRESERRGA